MLEQEAHGGKLTSSQENACKEGNVRGVFGYPVQIEELAKKYRISPDKIDYILSKYGTMEDYIKAYRENEDVDFEKDGPLRSNVRHSLFIDVCSRTQNNHLSRLYRAIYPRYLEGSRFDSNLVFFDGKKVLEGLEMLPQREKDIICYRFGLTDGRTHTIDEIGKIFGLTRERIIQVENKTIRKLRKPAARQEHFKKLYDEKESEGKQFTPQEEEKRRLLLDRIYSSNLIFTPDEEYSQDLDSITMEELREMASELSSIQIEATKREQTILEATLEGTPIETLNFSVRTYYRLKRRGITTVEQLRAMSKDELMATGYMGSISLQEIEEKLAELETKELSAIGFIKDGLNCGLEELRAKRDELAREVEKLNSQIQSAEQILASYDKLLESKQKGDKQPESR